MTKKRDICCVRMEAKLSGEKTELRRLARLAASAAQPNARLLAKIAEQRVRIAQSQTHLEEHEAEHAGVPA